MSDYGILRLDRVVSAKVGSIESMVHDDVLQNGMIAMVGGLVEGEREIREVIVPTSVKLEQEPVVLIGAPEVRYEEYTRTDNALEKFATPAGEPARSYWLKQADIYSVSENMVTPLDGDAGPQVGNFVVAQDGSLIVAEIETPTYSDYAFLGRIIDLESIGTSHVVGGDASGQIVMSRIMNLVVIEVYKNHRP